MRRGKASRRQLEFGVVVRAVKKDKARFIARLQRHIRPEGECLIWKGRIDRTNGGYPVMNFRGPGNKHVPVRVHVVFVILQIAKPIPVGCEAGHTCDTPACIRHVELQKWQDNLRQRANGKKARTPECPF